MMKKRKFRPLKQPKSEIRN